MKYRFLPGKGIDPVKIIHPTYLYPVPYVAAARSLQIITDEEYMDPLWESLKAEGMSIRRVICTRRASSRLHITGEPLTLLADFSDHFEGSDVLIQLVREVESEGLPEEVADA